LRGFVDLDENIGEGWRRRRAGKARDEKSDCDKPKALHHADFPQAARKAACH
jgi:hypothetical protein